VTGTQGVALGWYVSPRWGWKHDTEVNNHMHWTAQFRAAQ